MSVARDLPFFESHGSRQFAVWLEALDAALAGTPWFVDGIEEAETGEPTVRLKLREPASGRSDG